MSNLISKDFLFDSDKVKALYNTCASLAKSPLIRPDLRQKPEAVFSIVMLARELDIPPMIALSKINFISGTPTLPATMMMGLVRAKFKDARFIFKVDHQKQSVECTGYRDANDKDGFTSFWDMQRAKMLGLAGKDNYIKQPVTMLRHRATSEVINTLWPDVLYGVHSTEEMIDMENSNDVYISPIDQDFPVPENEKQCGPEYRIQNAKFRGLQLKDIDPDELSDYLESIRKRGADKAWEVDLLTKGDDFLDNFDKYMPKQIEVIEPEKPAPKTTRKKEKEETLDEAVESFTDKMQKQGAVK